MMDAIQPVARMVRAAKRTRRVRLRLREHELSVLTAAAAKRGEYVAEFVRQSSLAAARGESQVDSG